MKDAESLHLKVQEHCDCYATTDPLKEMSDISQEKDNRTAAVKWLALAALHGINNNASKISIATSPQGGVSVKAKYRESYLPSPTADIGAAVMETIREIAHFDGKKGKTPLSLGIRDSSVELKIKMKSSDDGEKLTISFPE